MPPRGTDKGTKRARQYEHIKDSLQERGSSEDEAEEIAARTVNKERARSGEAEDLVEALARGHLVRQARRTAQPPQGPSRAHARPALRGGEESEHPRSLDDDQGRASARPGRAVRRSGPDTARFSGGVSIRDGRGTSPM